MSEEKDPSRTSLESEDTPCGTITEDPFAYRKDRPPIPAHIRFTGTPLSKKPGGSLRSK